LVYSRPEISHESIERVRGLRRRCRRLQRSSIEEERLSGQRYAISPQLLCVICDSGHSGDDGQEKQKRENACQETRRIMLALAMHVALGYQKSPM